MIDSRASLSVLVVQALTYCLPGASSTSLHAVMFLLVIVQARMMYILQAREKARRSNEPSMSPTENSRLDKARLELDPSLYRARAQTSKLARGWLVDSPRYTALKHTKKITERYTSSSSLSLDHHIGAKKPLPLRQFCLPVRHEEVVSTSRTPSSLLSLLTKLRRSSLHRRPPARKPRPSLQLPSCLVSPTPTPPKKKKRIRHP